MPNGPLLLRWQGAWAAAAQGPLGRRIAPIAGAVICVLMAGLPLLSRGGLGLLIAASGLLWILWALSRPAGKLGSINLWILGILAIATVATGCSPVPVAAFKGLLKLISYLGVYALLRELLVHNPRWWDRIVAALLGGSLLTSVLGIRQ
ncbi:MAG: putative bicarbonate transporter, IctB family, partial [Cyanobacteria bacterium M_surface_7_m2_040]|nr:putative bicarbonate transporter, IctB family [Cyanobacteria bacterium M_surface_7_m2_040]